MRALPEPGAAQAEAVRRITAAAPDRAAARPDPGTTTALVQACSDHRRVQLDYRSEAGSEAVMEVDPWAVVVRHGRWYLLCRSVTRDAQRAYRIDRIRGVETSRLVGSTSNPVWYAEQLAAIPASYRIVTCVEVQEAALAIGQRLLAAGGG